MSGDKLKQVEARQRAASLLVERDESIIEDAKRKVSEKKEKMIALHKQWQAHSQPLVQSIEEANRRASSNQVN